MKLFKLTLIVAALSFLALSCTGEPGANRASTSNTQPATADTPAAASTPSPMPDELAATRETYAQFCVRCHRPDGTGGDFELEDGAKLKVVSLREHGIKDSDKHLADKIADGDDGMPAFKNRLKPEQIDALVRFIRREFHGRSATGNTQPASPTH